MKLTEKTLEAVIVSVLAVYQYSVDKVWKILPDLRKAELTDPYQVCSQNIEDLGNNLKMAGYDRGGITYIIAPRYQNLMKAIQEGQLDELEKFLNKNDKTGMRDSLCKIKGFGPKSFETVWFLLKEE